MKGLRRAGAKTLEEANRYLEEEFLPDWERRFTVQLASAADAHRPLGPTVDLASALSHVEPRQVTNGYTVSWNGRHWQIPKEAVTPGLQRTTVRIEQRLDGRMMARTGGRHYELSACEKPEKAQPKPKAERRRHVPAPGSSRWMDNFHLGWKAPAEQAGSVFIAAEGARRAPSAAMKTP